MASALLHQIGSQARAARRAAGLRQEDVAKRAGVSRYTVVKLERGDLADVNYKTLLAILEAVGLELRVEPKRFTDLPVLGEKA